MTSGQVRQTEIGGMEGTFLVHSLLVPGSGEAHPRKRVVVTDSMAASWRKADISIVLADVC